MSSTRMVNHGTITGTLSLFKILPLNRFNLILAKKDFTEDGKEFEKVPRTVTETKGHLHRQLFGFCKILWRIIMESQNYYASSIRDQRNGRKSSTKNEGRNFSPNATVRIYWKNGGLILRNANAICETSRTSWRMGKLPMQDDSKNLAKDPSFRSEQWSNITRFEQEIDPDLTNLARKSYR